MKQLSIILFIHLAFGLKLIAQEYPIFIQLEKITLEFSDTDSIEIPEYYANKKVRDSLAKIYGNWHDRARHIEQVLIRRLDFKIEVDSVNRIVHLKNGKEVRLVPNLLKEEVEYTFDKYFERYECLLFRVQWYEGNDYCLLDLNSGKFIHMYGKPYFSEDGKYIISVNADIESGYSSNGLQLFSYQNHSFQKLWEYDVSSNWGPNRAKWISENEVIIENYREGTIDKIWREEYFYKRLIIEI